MSLQPSQNRRPEHPQASSAVIPLLLTILILASIFFFAFQPRGIAPSEAQFVVPVFFSLLALGSLFVFPDYPGVSPSKIYGSVLWTFNFGLVAQWVVGVPFSPKWLRQIDWLNDADSALAAVYVMAIAVAAFAVGVQLGRVLASNRGPVPGTDSYTTNRGLATIGVLSMYVALASWLFLATSALGLRFLLASYEEYLFATESTPMGIPLTLLIASAALLGASYKDPRSKTAFKVFLVWAIAAFLIGLRGEALFPLLTYLAARSLWAPVFLRFRVVVLVAVGAMAGVAATWIRSTGIGDLDWDRLDLNPLLAVAEMGGSSFVTYFIYGIHEDGYPFLGLSQVLLPFVVVARRLGLAQNFPYEEVSLNYLISNSFTGSGRGGSVTAEAYHGSGYLGVVVVLGLIGVVLTVMTRLDKTPITVAWTGFVAGTLLAGVRNSSENVLVYVLIMLLLMFAVRFVNSLGVNKGPHSYRSRRIAP